jgi:predicted secreted Zn-dependent protease
VPAGASVQNLVSYYDVTGRTSDEVLASLLRDSPRINEVPVFALTEWEVSWQLRHTKRVGKCRLEQPQIQLTIRTTLPRFKTAGDAPAELQSLWRSFVVALVALGIHEAGHKNLGLLAVAAVADTLRALQHNRDYSCDSLVTGADQAAHSRLQQFYEMNAEYDATTMHGGTQGAVWPPLPLKGAGRSE